MSRVFFVTLFLALFFTGCTNMSPKPQASSFSDEDLYILMALNAQKEQKFDEASRLFEELYKKTKTKEYLYKSLSSDIAYGANQNVLNKVELYSSGDFDAKLARFKLLALVNLVELNSAKEVAIELSSKTDERDDYLYLADILLRQGDYVATLDVLEKLYAKNHEADILDKISLLMYINLDQKKEAIAKVESHTRIYGCGEMLCERLLSFYSDQNNPDGMLQTNLRIYKETPTKDVAQKVVQLYIYKRDFKGLEEFLLQSKSDDELLLSLYAKNEEFLKAKNLADELYAKTNRVEFLAQSAMYEYENAKDKKDKALLERVSSALEFVIKSDRNPMHLNYLGYLLIDHNIDIARGMELVKEALKENEDSIYYLDSLAWGYFKMHKCKDAKKIMDKVVELGGDDNDEVKLHIKEIEKCLKGRK